MALPHVAPSVDLHPDFGPSFGDGPNYGIPVTVVGGAHPQVRVHFQYAGESDQVRYPLGSDTRIEGGRRSDGDRHAIVVDRGTCRLYETFATQQRNGRWHAGSGAVWSLTSNALRPNGWTSADAAGLPILPGLLRWNEVKHRDIDHAIRFTTDVTSTHHLWPARHDAGSQRSRDVPADGCPLPAARVVPPGGLRAAGDGGGQGDEDLRPGARRQRLAVVLPGRAERAVADLPDRGTSSASRRSKFVAVDTSSLKVSNDSGATR